MNFLGLTTVEEFLDWFLAPTTLTFSLYDGMMKKILSIFKLHLLICEYIKGEACLIFNFSHCGEFLFAFVLCFMTFKTMNLSADFALDGTIGARIK